MPSRVACSVYEVTGVGASSFIAVIDDDRAVRVAVSSLLRSLGLNCLMFDSARKFMHHPERGRASCIITDVHMPTMSGLQLQQWLMEGELAVPMIFITGDASAPSREQAMVGGAAGYLEKPFDPCTLIECLTRLALLP